MHHKRQSRNRVAGVSFVTGLPCGWLGSESESVFESVDRLRLRLNLAGGGSMTHAGGLFSRGFGQKVLGNQVRRW